MARSEALKAAQKRYEEKRNARKVLLRLSEEEAEALDAALGQDESREQGARRLLQLALAARSNASLDRR